MPRTREQIAQRIAQDIQRGWVVNVGVGIPTLVTSWITDVETMIHSENGILGLGPPPPEGEEDPNVIDAGKTPATIVPGGAFFDSLLSFGMIRGGHLDLAVMGSYQVSSDGDMANWKLPGRRVAALGGAADLAAGANRVWIAMEHVSRDGAPRLLEACSYPLTAAGVVGRVYTDLGVFEPATNGAFAVLELAEDVSFSDAEAATGAKLV